MSHEIHIRNNAVSLKRLIVGFFSTIALSLPSTGVMAEELVLIEYKVDTGLQMFVDKASIRKVGNAVYVELLFDMGFENPMKVRSQRLLNCRARESTLLKMGINNQPMETPKGIISAAYVPADGSSYAKVFDYVCSVPK